MAKIPEDWEEIGKTIYFALNIWAILSLIFIPLGVWKFCEIGLWLVKKIF